MFKIEGVDRNNSVSGFSTGIRMVKVHIMVARTQAVGEYWAGEMVFGIIIVVVVNHYQYPSYFNGFCMRRSAKTHGYVEACYCRLGLGQASEIMKGTKIKLLIMNTIKTPSTFGDSTVDLGCRISNTRNRDRVHQKWVYCVLRPQTEDRNG